MVNFQGFSLFEVLVALVLISCASLGFLTRQWQSQQFLNQSVEQAMLSLQVSNQLERVYPTCERNMA
ncbi:prepilin-type N-terminal cleavage/methylation domain-containing protein [Legionella dresdenensis]|uniref:Prepilin-type N-terminal cleavage/methylation domain-containing protein n=1 Tax=Legionella dresdenensis TaxID=450200 RepID=A0ABV8CD85_9GAMM